MKYSQPLIPATFVERPNRFLTRVEIEGKVVDSHLPDPGRLRELLTPGAELRVQPVPELSTRKTRFTTTLVRYKGVWVSVISIMANTLVKEWLQENRLSFFNPYTYDRAEVTVGKHRFDFRIMKNDLPVYIEVKSVTYCEEGIAKFPDAVTERGARHVNALLDLHQQGIETHILFVCQRHDAEEFRPMWDRDPHFSRTLYSAFQRGLNIHCVSARVNEKGIQYHREIPLNLAPPEDHASS